MNATSVAAAVSGMFCTASTFEKTTRHPAEPVPGHALPETMYDLRLSGENAAAVAPEISRGVVVRELLAQLVQTKTVCGESTVSEKITVLPSGEIASTLPATFLIPPAEEPPETSIAPFVPKTVLSTPRYSLAPVRSKRAEFGTNGRLTGVPAVKLLVELPRVIGTIRVMQVVVVAPHPVEVAYTVGLVGVVLPDAGRTIKLIAV